MVFQHFNLFNNLNILDNLTLAPVQLKKCSKDEAVVRANKMLEKVGLADKTESYPSQLSGGQKQRVAIARAMANNPDIILADEPTGALDSKTGRLVMDIFHELHEKQGKTIVLITHSNELAAETPRIITISDGNIVSEKTNGGKGVA
jgi:putative ABC transport system ATP-binding protein